MKHFKYLGFALQAGICMTVANYMSKTVFHIEVPTELSIIAIQYVACYCTVTIINTLISSFLKKSSTNVEQNVEQSLHHDLVSQPTNNITYPNIENSYKRLIKLIKKLSFDNEIILPNLIDIIEQIYAQYGFISTNFSNHLDATHTEQYLFLKQDVSKFFESFCEEMNTLLILEIQKNPSFDDFKNQLIDLMLDRAKMVNSKLSQINQQIFDNLTQTTLINAQTNQVLLKAKM